MQTLLYLLICIVLLLLFILLKSMQKNTLIIIVCSIIIIQIIIQPKLCIEAAILGTKLFFYKVFPSLFPFLVISNIIILYNGIVFYSKLFGVVLCKPIRLPLQCSFVLIISMLCGYPMGAKFACELLENGTISSSTCQRLLNIASNASPLFVIGAVGTSMMKNTSIGYLILLSNIISCFIMAFLIPTSNTIESKPVNNKASHKMNIGDIMKSSIDNAIKTSLSIGGFVIIFSVINNIIKSNILFNIALIKIQYIVGIQKEIIEGFLLGIVEMTNGCYLISSSSASILLKIMILSFLITFSGISIIAQVYSFTYKYNLSIKIYSLRKVLHGIISAIISAILYELVFKNLSVSTFGNSNFTANSLFLALILVLLALPIIFGFIRSLFDAA